jgi:transcription elongation GreA/GreB family factor
LTKRLAELSARITGAVEVDSSQPSDEIRFGATVTVRGEAGERTYQIVGVDEASAREGRIAFSSPLARALLGRHAGDEVVAGNPRGEEELVVVAIRYGEQAGPDRV